MKHLYIHIGTHRTGTKALQLYLDDNTRRLLRHGISYNDYSYELACDMVLSSPYDDKMIDEHKVRYDEKGNNVIWSGESFFGKIWEGYANIGTIAKDLRKITHDVPTTIIAFIRNREDFIRSAYSLYLSNGNRVDYDTYYKMMNRYSFDWNELLGEYRSQFKDVRDIRYEGTDVINTMLQIVGAPFRNLDDNYYHTHTSKQTQEALCLN